MSVMANPPALPRPVRALQPLLGAPLDSPFLAGAWMGLTLVPPVFAAVMVGATVAVMDAMSRITDK